MGTWFSCPWARAWAHRTGCCHACVRFSWVRPRARGRIFLQGWSRFFLFFGNAVLEGNGEQAGTGHRYSAARRLVRDRLLLLRCQVVIPAAAGQLGLPEAPGHLEQGLIGWQAVP